MFLCFRTKPITEKHLTHWELRALCQYVTGKRTLWVAATIGRYSLVDGALYDRYNFEPDFREERATIVRWAVNLFAKWHKTGYKGYPIVVELPEQYLTYKPRI